MICASFLVKILLIDWKKGEKYFAQKLVDYDPVSNNGGWTWVASNGADSQPYFRIMNPWLQAEKHDPNVEYIHKWLPELRELKPKDIHKWEINCSSDEFKHINYNCPMVNYKEQRNKALLLYKSIM
jgi:deoxyribodipyrimidine photo-lyase